MVHSSYGREKLHYFTLRYLSYVHSFIHTFILYAFIQSCGRRRPIVVIADIFPDPSLVSLPLIINLRFSSVRMRFWSILFIPKKLKMR